MAFEALQKLISNPLETLPPETLFAGILGDRPSSYAKSPSIWNPAFRALGLAAVYVPLDVPGGSLGAVSDVLRETPEYVGGNVTVPYKVEVMRYLDRLDPLAESIGAVNTLARDETGALVGYNTDGQGALDALTEPQPGQPVPFVESLAGARILLLGAGGAARAVAFTLGRTLGSGRMWIANRNADRAAELAGCLRAAGVSVEPLELDALANVIGQVTLLINATSVGQSGLRPLPSGEATVLEPYSPVAPVPAVPVADQSPESLRSWVRAASRGITLNSQRSMELLAELPSSARCLDLVYSPLETTFLRHARLSGYPTMNGKAMSVCQAVAAFFIVMRLKLSARTGAAADRYARVQAEMYRAW
jgi:shikimate dehydrogenase